MQIPRRKSEELHRLKTEDDGPIYLTSLGLTRLKERLQYLKQSLPALIKEAQRTADYGDRSENAEYKEAKANLRRTNRQILTIGEQLKRIVIITHEKKGEVALGSTVTLEAPDGGKKTFEIVGPRETDPGAGRISHESPLGKALMHHRRGDDIIVKTPNGSRTFRIIAIN